MARSRADVLCFGLRTSLFPPGPGSGFGIKLTNSGFSPDSLDSPGFRRKVGAAGGGRRSQRTGRKKKKKKSPNGIILVAELDGEVELSEASWEPGAQRWSPGRLMRVSP